MGKRVTPTNKSGRLRTTLSRRKDKGDDGGSHQDNGRDTGSVSGKGGGENRKQRSITVFLRPQTRRQDTTDHKSQDNQHLCEEATLQDGRDQVSSGLDPGKRLPNQNRFGRRVLPHDDTPIDEKVLPLPVEGPGVSVQCSSVRLPRRPSPLHHDVESGAEGDKETRREVNRLYGRLANNGRVRRGGMPSQRYSLSHFEKIRADYQFEEVSTDTEPDNGLPGVSGEHSEHDVLDTKGEGDETSQESETDVNTCQQEQTRKPDRAPISTRDSTVSSGLRPTDPPSPQFTDRDVKRGGGGPSSPHSTSSGGSELVARVRPELEWKADPPNTTDVVLRHRCLGGQMGCGMVQSNRQIRLQWGVCVCDVQQHSGAHCHFQWGAVPCERCGLAGLCSSCKNGQSHSPIVCEPHGGQGCSALTASGEATPFLPQQEDNPDSGIHPRERERYSGLPLEVGVRLVGGEAPSSPLSLSGREVGPAYPGWVCGGGEHAVQAPHQLPSQPDLSLHRYSFEAPAIGSEHLAQPAVPFDTSPVSEDKERKGNGDDATSSMAQPTLVGSPVEDAMRLAAGTPSAHPTITQVVRRGVTRLLPNMELGRSEAIAAAFGYYGFSQKAIELWLDKYKHSTKLSTYVRYDRMFKRYQSWCTASGRHCYDISDIDVADFCVSLLEEGKISTTVTGYISMLNMTRDALCGGRDEYPLTASSFIKGLKQGAAKRAPPKQKGTTWYHMSTDFWLKLSKLGDPKTVTIGTLRDRLILLLMIDGMARASDISCLARDAKWFEEAKTGRKYVLLTYWNTKEMRNKPGSSDIIHYEYVADRNICTYTHVAEWLRRTTSWVKEMNSTDIKHNATGKLETYAFYPLICSLEVNNENRITTLSAQRIAKQAMAMLAIGGVDTSRFKAHSIRGAAASKLLNLGMSDGKICVRARWKNRNTFYKHYVRDVLYLETDASNCNKTHSELLRMAVSVRHSTAVGGTVVLGS